jgi:hypothetical protein
LNQPTTSSDGSPADSLWRILSKKALEYDPDGIIGDIQILEETIESSITKNPTLIKPLEAKKRTEQDGWKR